ncbi:MAG: DegV family protein [Clostridia bacterium]|nr:DegV family protein [Clostridia bacterium]
MAVKFLIDSASDVSKKEAESMGVSMLPMAITFGTEEYFDGVDLLPVQFYEKLVESSELPKTSQISAYRFEEEFERLTANGDQVVAIVISSKLSGTYNMACQASEKFNGKVFVVDSMSAATGERLLLEIGLSMAKNGSTAEEIYQELNKKKEKIVIMAMVDTLEYLKKGGRVSAAVAFAGQMLSIKPVVGIVDGEVKLLGKAMGSRKANNLLNQLVAQKGGIDFSLPCSGLWSGLSDALIQKYLRDSAPLYKESIDQVPVHILGPTIGTHVGPGAVGVAFFGKK